MAEQEPDNPNEHPSTAPDAPALERRVEQLESQVQALSAELHALQRNNAPETPLKARPIAKPFSPPTFVAPLFRNFQGVPNESLETQLGARILSKVGVVLLLIGAAWFLKWAFDNRWIGPGGRVLTGLLAGAGIVLWSERFRRKRFSAFSYALKAVGSGVLYLSLWAAFQLYHLMPAWLVLLAMVAVTAWNAFMAISQDAELLAAYAFLGAYLTPALLSSGGDHEIFLFTYLFVIAAAALALLRVKSWPRLLLGALPVTAGYFIAWYIENFQVQQTHLTIAFALFLWAAFAGMPLIARQAEGVIVGVLTPLGAAAFGSLAVYSVLADSGGSMLEPWFAVGFAAAYLLLMRVRREGVASAVHLSLGVVFLTIAIPLKATGRGITVGWLAEALALLWVSSLPHIQTRAGRALRWLACASLLLGVAGAILGPWINGTTSPAFANRNFATSMGAIAALATTIYLASRMNDLPSTRLNGRVIAALSFVLLNGVLLVAMHREIFRYFQSEQPTLQSWAEAHRYANFCFSAWMMVQGAALMLIGFWRRIPLARWLGLILLAITIVKAFAWDMRYLGTGYRVVSYLVLGIVLMAVSFAYQNDWLGLKEPTARISGNDEELR